MNKNFIVMSAHIIPLNDTHLVRYMMFVFAQEGSIHSISQYFILLLMPLKKRKIQGEKMSNSVIHYIIYQQNLKKIDYII